MNEQQGPDTSATGMPDAISRYFDAQQAADSETALSAFEPHATVVDDGHRYQGTTEIHQWLTSNASEYELTTTLVSVERIDTHTWNVVNHVEGNFPGGQVDLNFRFSLTDDLIASLAIAL